MARGGRRPGAGRPKGSKSKRTLAKVPLIPAQAHRQTVEDKPLDVLVKAMRDERLPIELRLAAAARAAPYYHARVSSGIPKTSFEMSEYELRTLLDREKEHRLRSNLGQRNFRTVNGVDS
jgi:hypothetical protein